MSDKKSATKTPINQKNRRFIRWAIRAIVISLAALIAQSDFVIVTSEKNGAFVFSSYKTLEDNFSHPRLKLLRQREALDAVTSTGQTQFEKITLLRHWVRQQWENQGPFHYPPWDAVEILNLARKNLSRGFCAQYAIVFLQACQAMGIHARYVNLNNHFAASVWSDDYNKWGFVDPTNDVYYEKDGQPLSGRALYEAYWKKKTRGILKVGFNDSREEITPSDLTAFQRYAIDTKNNQLSEPITVDVNGVRRVLTLSPNYKSYPFVGKDSLTFITASLAWQIKEAQDSPSVFPTSEKQEDFRVAFNQTYILPVRPSSDNTYLQIILIADNSPTFREFLFRTDKNKNWKPAASDRLKWALHAGKNQLLARVHTNPGWQGNASSVRVLYKPPLWPSLPYIRLGNIK